MLTKAVPGTVPELLCCYEVREGLLFSEWLPQKEKRKKIVKMIDQAHSQSRHLQALLKTTAQQPRQHIQHRGEHLSQLNLH